MSFLDLFAKRPQLSAPPISKVGGANVNAKLPERRGAKVAVVWPLHRRVGIISLGIRLDVGNV